jgi:hypothetical protein
MGGLLEPLYAAGVGMVRSRMMERGGREKAKGKRQKGKGEREKAKGTCGDGDSGLRSGIGMGMGIRDQG